MMLDEGRCRRIIAEAFPGLDVQSARYFAAGWDYELWEVHGDLLFRFPLREECGPPLLVEARLLAALADELSVAIPRPELVSQGCAAFPLPFFAYRKLPGVALGETKLDAAARGAVARQIGRFLSELHAFPIERAAAAGVRVHDGNTWRERYVGMQAKVQRQVTPRLSPTAAGAVEEFFREFLANERFFSFQPRLIHGDLDVAHVLVDAERALVTGVIDFGDARVGDPALDFAGYPEFKETFDAPLRDAILAAYELPVDDTLRERAAIYRDRISPFHAVLYGVEIGNDEWLRRGLEAIEAWSAGKKHK